MATSLGEPRDQAPPRTDLAGDPCDEGNTHAATRTLPLLDFLRLLDHRAILEDVPHSTGGGIGQSRTLMLLLGEAHLGEISTTVWSRILKEICTKKNIFALQ